MCFMWNYMCIRWLINWSISTKMHGATIRFIQLWHSEDRASWYILIITPTRSTNFSNLFLEKTTCFGQYLCPSSGVKITCMYCCVYSKKLLMMAEELSETCGVVFQNKLEKLVFLVGFVLRKNYTFFIEHNIGQF